MLILLLILLVVAGARAAQVIESKAGIHLILDEAATAGELRAATQDERVALYDYKFRDEDDRPAPKHFLLRKEPDVVLDVVKSLTRLPGKDGRTLLGVELDPQAAVQMEKLTREHLGRSAAFVIDGEVITAHKIQAVIEDGKFFVSRCSDNGCEYILARLKTK
jgi:preprotein translocase subunit SecD